MRRSWLFLIGAALLMQTAPQAHADFIQGDIQTFTMRNCAVEDQNRCLKIEAASAQSSQIGAVFFLRNVEVEISQRGLGSVTLKTQTAYVDLNANVLVIDPTGQEFQQRIIDLRTITSQGI